MYSLRLLFPKLLIFSLLLLPSNSVAVPHNLESLLEEKYSEANLQKQRLNNFDYNTKIDINRLKDIKKKDLKSLYHLKTKEQQSLAHKRSRYSAEIYLLERLMERKNRKSKSDLHKDEWIEELLYLSKLPVAKNEDLNPRYYLDLVIVLKSKNWSMPFGQLLKHYLSYSPANDPIDPFAFSFNVDYENKKVLESTLNKKDSTEKDMKPETIKKNNKPAPLSQAPTTEDFLLEELPEISFPEEDKNSHNSGPVETMQSSGEFNIDQKMEIQLIPNGKVQSLEAPVLKKVDKREL